MWGFELKKSIAFFDFDGTITHKDSLIKFIQYHNGYIKFYLGLFILSPVLICYKFKIIPNYVAKEIILRYFFRNSNINKFNNIAIDYSLNHIPNILREQAIDKINWHKQEGHTVVVVSASIECWLKPWCEKNNLELIATKLEIKDEVITGNLITKNCYGIEKRNRINEKYDLTLYDFIYAYGDTKGDKEMLELADIDKRFYRCF